VLERRPLRPATPVRVPADREGHPARRPADGDGRLGRQMARRSGRRAGAVPPPRMWRGQPCRPAVCTLRRANATRSTSNCFLGPVPRC